MCVLDFDYLVSVISIATQVAHANKLLHQAVDWLATILLCALHSERVRVKAAFWQSTHTHQSGHYRHTSAYAAFATMNATQRTKKGIINEDEESEPFIEDGENAFNGNPATTSTATAIRQESSSKYKGLIMGFSMIACCLNMWFMEALLRYVPIVP